MVIPSVFLVIYLILSLIILSQLVVLLAKSGPRSRVVSFKSGFNVLCLLWTMCRTCFWLLIRLGNSSVSVGILLLFWLPHALQVGP